MAKSPHKTHGEQAFERYLMSQGINDFEFEPEYEGLSTHPDYSIEVQGYKLLFEVKDFEFKADQPEGGAYDPYKRIRQKIDDAREKFKDLDQHPCCLVLYKEPGALVDLDLPEIILGAMLGNVGFKVPLGQRSGNDSSDGTQQMFLGSGKMIRPNWSRPQNTTISAIISLICYTEQDAEHLGVIVCENPFAKHPLPRELFCDEYDQRWGPDGEYIMRIFVGEAIKRMECNDA